MQEDLATDDVMLLDIWDQVGRGQQVSAVWAEGVGGARLPAVRSVARCYWKGPCAAVSPFPLLGLHFLLCKMGAIVPILLNSIR